MKSFLSPGWPPRGGVTCVWTPKVRTAGVERWPAWAGGGVFSTTGLQSPRRQDAAGGGRPAAPQARLWASELLRLLEGVVALARLQALTPAAALAHSNWTLQDPWDPQAPKLELHPPRRTPAPRRGSHGRPRVLCASQEAEKARGCVGLCLCVSPRGFAQRQVRQGDAQLAEEGEVCAEAHGCRHSGYARVCGRSTRLWVASVWLCAGLWMLVHLCVYRHYLGCLHARSLVCVSRPTSDLFRSKRMHSGGMWRPRGADLLSPPPLTFSLSFLFYPFLSIDRHV